MSCPRDGCCSLYASFSCTSLITVRPPPFQRISRDASTDRARTQQSAPTPDRTVRLPRAILRPSPASSRSSPPPDPPAASPASRDPHDVSARPPAGAGIAGVNCPSPGTLTSTLTPDRADAHHQGYPHHGCPPGKQPHHRPAQGPHPGAARARARAQRSPTRRGHRGTAREGAPPIPPQATGDDRPGAQVGVPKAKRAPHPRPKHPTTRHRTRARRPEDSAAPTASVASHAPPPLDPSAVARGGDDPGSPTSRHRDGDGTDARGKKRKTAEQREAERIRSMARRAKMTPEERKRANDARQRRRTRAKVGLRNAAE